MFWANGFYLLRVDWDIMNEVGNVLGGVELGYKDGQANDLLHPSPLHHSGASNVVSPTFSMDSIISKLLSRQSSERKLEDTRHDSFAGILRRQPIPDSTTVK